MASEDLTRWTPLALDFAAAPIALDWGDLRAERFTDPFFDQTVERWAGRAEARLHRTDLKTLLAVDATAPSLDPAAFIFHLSRCGSTLLSRLLATLPGMVVVSEPSILNRFLLEQAALGDRDERVRVLRALVRALGRKRRGDERRYVVKLSSWNVAQLALYRAAFPEARIVWLQRAPLEVLVSLYREPAGWEQLCRDPDRAEALLGIPAAEIRALGGELFSARVVRALLDAAQTLEGTTLYLDYGELPAAIWARVAPFLGWSLSEAHILRMSDEARFEAKKPERATFTRKAATAALSPALAAYVERDLAPRYRALEQRRREQIARVESRREHPQRPSVGAP